MKPLDRNISILEHIVGYCDQIEETIRRFGNGGKFAVCGILWHTVMAPLIRRSPGKF